MWFGWLVSRKKLVHVDAICRFIFVQVVPSGFGATQRKIGGKLPVCEQKLFGSLPKAKPKPKLTETLPKHPNQLQILSDW